MQTIRTPFSEGLYAEAGPIRIPGMHKTVLKLANDHGLALVPFASTTGASVISVRGVTARVPDDLRKAASTLELKPDEAGLGQSSLLQRYVRDLPSDMGTTMPTMESYSAWETHDRVTWPEWLRARGASAGAVTLMTLGGDSKELSALYVLRQVALLQNTDQFFKIQGGMDQLPRAMAKSLRGTVRYDSAVVRVEQSRDSGTDRLSRERTSGEYHGRTRDFRHPIFDAPADRRSTAALCRQEERDRLTPVFPRDALSAGVQDPLLGRRGTDRDGTYRSAG